MQHDGSENRKGHKGFLAPHPGMADMSLAPNTSSGPDDPHLLVVDDDERLRALLQRYLSSNGYRVTAAPGAAEARALMKSMEFDLLILDVMMPGESGLDLTQSVRKAPAKQRHRESLTTAQTTSFQFATEYPGRLLVVEDSSINQKLAVKLLEKLGYQADVASDGLQAVEAVRRSTYDLIFMDCQMPEMDGYEATRRIRMLESSKANTRIVAMTANAMKGDREACLAAGMDDYVSKPITVEEVKRALREGLGKDQRSVPAQTS